MAVIKIKATQDLRRLRRLALAAQGLVQAEPYGRGLAGARRAIIHLGYVQIDTISVVERAHHHVFYTRVPNYKPEILNQLLRNRDIFEYWSHAAAFLPIADYRFSLPYKYAIKRGQVHWNKNPNKKLMRELLARIRSDGPLRSRDIETRSAKAVGWWDWGPAKQALEQLYMEGDLMVSAREGFQKTYDLTERVLPPHVDTQMPSVREFAVHLVDQQLRCHGLVSLKGLTYQRRDAELRKAVKTLVNERIAERTLEQLQLPNGEEFIIQAGSFERRLARVNERVLILSPFDNSVIQRERLRALFHYDYRLESYLPAAKRQYGYFSLPLLYRDAFVGRMDCKAHRKNGVLEIKSLSTEQHDFDEDSVIAAWLSAVRRFSDFQHCGSVVLRKARPEHLTVALRTALESHE